MSRAGGLVAVVAVLLLGVCAQAGGQDCLNGFADDISVGCTGNSCDRAEANGPRVRIIPDLNFTCNGVINGWSAEGVTDDRMNRNMYPALQIWRPAGDTGMAFDRVVSETGDCNSAGSSLVCTFSQAIPVMNGDVIGVLLPRSNRDRFSIFFITITSQSLPTNYIFDSENIMTVDLADVPSSDRENDLPLIMIDFTRDPVVMPTTESPTDPPTTPPSESESPSPSSSTTPQPTSSTLTPEETSTQAVVPTTSSEPPVGPTSTSPLESSSTVPVTFSSSEPTGVTTTDTQPVPTTSSETPVEPTSTAPLESSSTTPVTLSSSDTTEVTTTDTQQVSTSDRETTPTTTMSDGGSTMPTTTMSDDGTSVPTTSDDGNTASTPTASQTASEDTNLQPSSSPSSPSMTLPPLPPPSPPAASIDIGATAGGVVAAVVVLLVLTVAVVILLLIVTRRRGGKKAYNLNTATSGVNDRDVALDNPTYSDPIPLEINSYTASAKPALQFMETAADYSLVGGDYDDIPAPVGEYEVPSQTDSHDLNVIANSATLPVTEKSPPPVSLETMPKKGNIQWGLVVPSQEQRDILAASTGNHLTASENVYEALAEHKKPEQAPHFFEECETYWAPSTEATELYQQLAKRKYREILRPQIQLTEHLGSGQFGTVSKGLWQSPAGVMEVAVKTLKPGSPEGDKVKFLQEAAINGQFRHPNVVQLMGVVTVGEPVMIVLELLSNGDLRDFLMKQRPVPGEMVPVGMNRMLLKFCQQVAAGMEYLARKAFVHRDLAARNILVAEDKICKISDFGMSRDLMDESYYVSHGGKIPVKWTAPEAINFKKYSTASDVWSFGAVLYEIWSLGHKPYEAYTNSEVIQLVDRGFRLPPPPGCPRELYQLMISCWHPDKARRPSFAQMVETLSQPHFDLLMWQEADTKLHPQVAVIGAPLEAAESLYPALQKSYASGY